MLQNIAGKLSIYPNQQTHYLNSIEQDILEARTAFLSWANSLPQPTNNLVQSISRSFENDSLPNNLLGERIAFWIGELFNADKTLQQKAALGCIAGYTYAFYQDHYLDSDDIDTRFNEVVKDFLFAKVIESFQSVAQDDTKFWAYFNKYLNEYSTATKWESTQSPKKRYYTSEDLRMVARRSALAKIIPTSYAIALNKDDEIAKYEIGLENYSIGLQIRDDLADCLPDLNHNKWTYVIAKILSARTPSESVLREGAVHSSTIESLLDESTYWLQESSRTMCLRSNSALNLYIRYIIDQNAYICTRVQDAKTKGAAHGDLIVWKDVTEVVRTRLES